MPSRPASEFDPDLLLEIVAEIARAVRPLDPERVAQRPWDRGRARSARFTDAPPARRIAESLGLSRPEVVRIALLPPGTRERTLGRQLGEDNQNWLTEDYIAHVLRLIASNLDVRTLTPAQYRAERSRLLTADASRSRHGGQLRLPNENQLTTAAGGWHRALRLAGLSGGQGRGGMRGVQPGSIVELIERCFAHHGAQPTSRDVVVFAKANGIPFPRPKRPWNDELREWKEERRAQGLPVPSQYPNKANRPDYTQDVGAARPGERRHMTGPQPTEEVAEWVAKYLRELPRGQRASKRGYDTWARGVNGAPWASLFDKHGGWSAVLATARESVEHERASVLRSPPR